MGLAGAEFTPHRGFFAAFDVNTGRKWGASTLFQVILEALREPALGRPPDLGGRVVENGGGGSVWDSLCLIRKQT